MKMKARAFAARNAGAAVLCGSPRLTLRSECEKPVRAEE